MFGCCITLLAGMHYKELVSQYSWAFLWLPPIATIATAVITHHHRQQTTTNVVPARDDVEANRVVRPPACTKAAWRKCWVEFWAFCAWSSMFWLAFLVSGLSSLFCTVVIAGVAWEQMLLPLGARDYLCMLMYDVSCKDSRSLDS
jgi:hypothetical protein